MLGFKVDSDGRRACIDEGPLRKSLDELHEFAQRLVNEARERLRDEIASEVGEARQELRVLLEESKLEVEQKLGPRFDKIEGIAQQALQKCEEMDKKQTRNERQQAKLAAAQAAAPELPSEAEVRKPSAATGGGGGGGGGSEKIPPGLENTLQQMRQDLDSLKIDYKSFEKETQNHLTNLQRAQEKIQAALHEEIPRFEPLEEFQGKAREELASASARLEELQEGLRAALAEMGSATEILAVKESVEALAARHEEIEEAVRGELVQQMAAAEERLIGLEEARASSNEAVDTAITLVNEVRGNAERISAAVSDMDRRLSGSEAGLGQQRAALALHNDKVTGRLEEISGSLGLLGTKADQAQVLELHGAVSRMAAESKAKEQSVLFGAKCLSCNREFEDTTKTSGTVDLYGEKQKAQLFAQVQQSLHSTKAMEEDIKMLTVKVGRTGRRVGNGTVYEGRDPVFGCAVEDVQMMRTTKSATGEKGKSPRRRPRVLDMTTGSAPFLEGASTPPHSARQKAGAFEGEQTRGSTLLLSAKEGPLDFKTPLSMLVGRSGGDRQDAQAARAINRGKLAPTPEADYARGTGSPGPTVW